MLFEVNTVIRDYKIISLVGQGGMGEVYLAEDVMLGKKIALKVLSQELSRNQNLINRFISEAKVQAALLHPNIVTLHSFFKEDGIYIMAMEFAEGQTIKEVIQKKGPINEKRAVNICLGILSGLSFAHSKGIIHRDIKSSNIMLSADDNVKIMDFGIAKVLGVKGLTETGGKLGTIYFMSPEQIMADPKIDQQTDVYSLGITLYEMLAGTLPFSDTDSQFKVMKEIVELKLKDPRDFYPYISPALVDILFKMTAKERKDRYKNCEGAAVALKSFLNPAKVTPVVKQEYAETRKTDIPLVPEKNIAEIQEAKNINLSKGTLSKQVITPNISRENEKTLVVPAKKGNSLKKIIIAVVALIIAGVSFLVYQFNKPADSVKPITLPEKTATQKAHVDSTNPNSNKSINKQNISTKSLPVIQNNNIVKKEKIIKIAKKEKNTTTYKKPKQEGVTKPVANKPPSTSTNRRYTD